MPGPTLLWLRRGLRLHDLPTLTVAHEQGGAAGVLPVFVLDPALWDRAAAVRRRWLAATLRATNDAYAGRLVLRRGDPATVISALAKEVHASSVHISRETTPYGRRRDQRVEKLLDDNGTQLVATGSPYAVGPGRVHAGSGGPYQVFTPFARAWRDHGWSQPATPPHAPHWAKADSDDQVTALIDGALVDDDAPSLPDAGEDAAHRQWEAFLEGGVAAYDSDRDRPDREGTSRMSPYLKLGVVHPRTLLFDLEARLRRHDRGAERYATELAWREFYADVLWHRPESAWADLRSSLAKMAYDEPQDAIAAWRAGQTGYPIVDAGMRQLLGQGWMHNRLRMITASFLTKDLHVWWPVGARHFLDHLIDADLASNNHGWQWVAGTGTDAAPYFRVFNPITQGKRFDPDGAYVRRWIPELGHLHGPAAHEPWDVRGGYDGGYVRRIVDHADERREALRRYQAATA